MKQILPNPLTMNVIIPTRERADTLFWTIKTCVEQNYENLNIIVCDNFSNDDTYDVVSSYVDERIQYVNPGLRLSMTQNWEFALSHVKEGYVTIIGDDDGLLPNAISNVAQILQSEKVAALSWMKSEYCWPNHVTPEWRNFLSIPLGHHLVEMHAKPVLRDISRFLLPYNRTPNLYNSFVDVSMIQAIKSKQGSFLNSIAPDIYSGLALLSEIEMYLYSIRPFSVNGASSHSNGTSANSSSSKKALEKFMKESNPAEIEDLGLVTGSVQSAVAECLFQANRYCHHGKLPLSKKVVLFFILREMANKGEDVFFEAQGDIQQFARRHHLESYLNIMKKFIKPRLTRVRPGFELGLDNRNILNLDMESFDVTNVYDAAQFVHSILGDDLPDNRVKYNGLSRICSRVLRRVRAVNFDSTL